MSHTEGWPRTKKQACTDAGTVPVPGHATPTTFFLRSEKDMHKADASQGSSNSSSRSQHQGQERDDNYGVQSLDETLEAAFAPKSPEFSSSPSNADSAKKRKVGNPVHPKIAAAAQRIISSDRSTERPSSRNSSVSSHLVRPLTPSPTRRHARSDSLTSLGRSFTPLRIHDTNLPSTPRSASVRSVRLSDEEGSIIDDTASQALHSSSEDEDVPADNTLVESEPPSSVPQLVMPSISMPTRRPFTERGKRIPRLKIMLAGPSGVGKTSLVKSMVQICEDIVHVDPITYIQPTSASADRHTSHPRTREICETNVSTRSCPSWWSEVEQGRGLRRRKSMGESVLERNLCFIDTPGWDMSGPNDQDNIDDATSFVFEYIEDALRRNTLPGDMSDADLLTLLSGGGGFQVDAILYMFHPTSHHMNPTEANILRRLSNLTNVIPIVGRADTCADDNLKDVKTAIRTDLEAAGVRTFTLQAKDDRDTPCLLNDTSSPFAVSSALGEDTDTMDASLMMSSEYMQPLVSSDLSCLVDRLFDPDNAQWLRHCAVKKFLQWRRDHIGASLDLHKRELRELALERLGCLHPDAPSSISSVLSSPSGVAIPHLRTSNGRESSPAPFRLVSAATIGTASQYDFSRHVDIQRLDRASTQLPQWAYELKIALETEHRERKQLTTSVKDHDDPNSALITHSHKSARGHDKLGEYAGGLNPKDPLGLLALGQRVNLNGWTMLQVAGGCGAIATALVWTIRNWATMIELLGFGTPGVQVPGYVVVSARESSRSPMDFLRNVLTGAKW